MARPKVKVQILPDYTQPGPSIYKLHYGKKYIVIKCKDHLQSVHAISKVINQFLKGNEGAQRKDGLYFHLCNYVKANPGKSFFVTVLLYSENGYQLLKKEHELLEQNRKDPECLNNNTIPYIPLYDDIRQSYGWLTRNNVLNYQKWLKRQALKKTKA